METIISRNPANGNTLREIPCTPINEIPSIIENARTAQRQWAKLSPKQRKTVFYNAREYILDHIDEIAELISLENGKPKFEAICNDILPALDLLTLYTKRAEKLLRDQPIALKLMKHRKSYLQFWPRGVVAIIAPWNFPFSIPFGEVVLALLAGNAVILKPSEVTTQIGLKIIEIFENAFLPKHLLQAIVGDGRHGAALVKSKVDKIFFTGSVQTGKRVMASASENLTPVVLELGGKDPMIILPDADLDYASSAALWGSFANSGQVCASTERILVAESIHDDFVKHFKEKAEKLQTSVGSHSSDLGVITYEHQKKIYSEQLAELNSENSKIVTGGKFSNDHTRLLPTIITNPDVATDCPVERTKVYREETFGPVVVVTKYKTIPEAIQKANHNNYGLLASVIGKDIAMAEQVARQIEAGSVLINEVIYTHGIPETPWGGVKDSGFGRVHSDMGFLEFVNVRHIHLEKWWAKSFKSLWWFPYTKHQSMLFRHLMDLLFRRSILRKLKALPLFLVEFVEMIKKEKRL